MNGTQQKNDGMFRTRDLPLAAYLALHGHNHVSIERRAGKGWWVYRSTDDLALLAQQYVSGEVTIDLPAYMDCVAKVRSDLYAYLGIN